MKQRFLAFVQTIVTPWAAGATGTPWGFTTEDLAGYGNANVEPDVEVDAEGEMKPVYLKWEEVEEGMTELGYKKLHQLDPYGRIKMVWMVELLPTTIL